MNYTVGEMLGRGGFGNVFSASDATGKQYAIKFFSANQPMSEDMLANVRRRFIKEVRIQMSINHDNVVPIIEAFEGEDLSYVMPKATCSLADEIETNKSDVAKRYMGIVSDIAAALDHLHSMQIYHRDLKPQNILRFDDIDGKIIYKISDFGLISMRESNLSNLTMTEMRKGSDAYTAPEITQKLSTATAQTDVYSLACILHDIVDDGIRVPCGIIRSNTSFADIFSVATRADPRSRFPTAKSFVGAVAAVSFSVSTPTIPAYEEIVNGFGGEAEEDHAFWESVLASVSTENESVSRFVFSKMNEKSLEKSIIIAGEVGQKIYGKFCEWVGSRRDFPFEYCDVLCDRIRGVFDKVDFERRFQGCYALLALGTSHNRWYVERSFMASLGPEIDDAFAGRAAIEFRVLDKKICPKLAHLKASINADIDQLHPVVSQAIKAICS